jgi:hypothetical protein
VLEISKQYPVVNIQDQIKQVVAALFESSLRTMRRIKALRYFRKAFIAFFTIRAQVSLPRYHKGPQFSAILVTVEHNLDVISNTAALNLVPFLFL